MNSFPTISVLFFLALFLISVPAHAKKEPHASVDGKNAVGKVFVKAESCTPLLAWKDVRKSNEKDLTYDVAVHLALKKFEQAPIAGEKVFYAENLHEMSIRPDKPLDPSGKYVWSFRLRNPDGKVSEWMVQPYASSSFFSLVSYGNIWLGFKTPSTCP